MSSIEDEEDPPPSVKSSKSSRNSDEINIKREVSAIKSPFTPKSLVERDVGMGSAQTPGTAAAAAFFQGTNSQVNQIKQSPNPYFNSRMPLKAAKFASGTSGSFAQNEYLNNYYRNDAVVGSGGGGVGNYGELQKIVGRPQHNMQFSHKSESKFDNHFLSLIYY